MLYYVPKRVRVKLRLGPKLGMASASNEHYVSKRQGDVGKVRSVCKVVEARRWSSEAILGVRGFPPKMCPVGQEDIHADIDNADQTHTDMAEAARHQVGAQVEKQKDYMDKHGEYDHRIKITETYLRLYGFQIIVLDAQTFRRERDIRSAP